MSRQRLRGQRRLGDQRQGAFRPDQQTGQIEVLVGEYAAEFVSAARTLGLGTLPTDQLCMVREQTGDLTDQFSLAGVAAFAQQRLAAYVHHMTVGQHNLQAADVTPHRTVLQPPATDGVDGNHAADRCHVAGSRVGAEDSPLGV